MSEPSGSQIKRSMTAEEIKFLAEWFRASHEEGWRPHIHAPGEVARIHEKLEGVYAAAERRPHYDFF